MKRCGCGCLKFEFVVEDIKITQLTNLKRGYELREETTLADYRNFFRCKGCGGRWHEWDWIPDSQEAACES